MSPSFGRVRIRERGEDAADAARGFDSDEAQLSSSLVRADRGVLIFGAQSDRATVLAVPGIREPALWTIASLGATIDAVDDQGGRH